MTRIYMKSPHRQRPTPTETRASCTQPSRRVTLMALKHTVKVTRQCQCPDGTEKVTTHRDVSKYIRETMDGTHSTHTAPHEFVCLDGGDGSAGGADAANAAPWPLPLLRAHEHTACPRPLHSPSTPLRPNLKNTEHDRSLPPSLLKCRSGPMRTRLAAHVCVASRRHARHHYRPAP